MKITLNSEEKQLLREVADEYKKETGDIPDYRRIVDLLSLRYENRLKADMRAVLGVYKLDKGYKHYQTKPIDNNIE